MWPYPITSGIGSFGVLPKNSVFSNNCIGELSSITSLSVFWLEYIGL